ncbi:MAG: hypothetical protein JWM71_1432, partial [Solirubrobacteraceae bacterium]|nr:hypothetical protein [Solirubrobacteraceae bacterium]
MPPAPRLVAPVFLIAAAGAEAQAEALL